MAALTHPPPKLSVVAAFVLIVLTQICHAEYKTVLYSKDYSIFEKGAVVLDSGEYVLELKTHCRLEIYNKRSHNLIWNSTNPQNNTEPCDCVFGPWGNLEVVGGEGVVWSALQSDPEDGFYVLILQRRGVLAIQGPALWTTLTFADDPEVVADDDRKSYMYSGDKLFPGQSLDYGKYSLKMQSDCNLVLYDDKKPIWATNTDKKSFNCVCKFQEDANLVIYGGLGEQIWASNTEVRDNHGNRDNHGDYLLVLQKDRQLVIYGAPLWDSKMDNKPSMKVNVVNSATTDAITQAIGIATVV